MWKILIALWAIWLRLVNSSPLTFELPKGSQECYYGLTTDTFCTIFYYFAVQHGEGNDFDVSYSIYGPDDTARTGKPIAERQNERQGEYSFLAEHKGEYAFCFYGGKAHDKIVDLEITQVCPRLEGSRDEKRAARRASRNLREAGDKDPLQDVLEESIDTIDEQLRTLERNLQNYKHRNIRNHYTVRSTERRIALFSAYGIALIIGMCIAQIAILQWFFQESRKQAV